MVRSAFALIAFSLAIGPAPIRAGPEPGPAADSLEQVLGEIATRNPDLESLAARVQSARRASGPAGAWPDPQFMIALSNMPLSRDETPLSGLQLELRQAIPWPGKLAAREQALKLQGSSLAASRTDRILALQARAEALAWQLAYLQGRSDLLGEQDRLLAQLAEAISVSYAAGRASQQDLIRPEVERGHIAERQLEVDRQERILLGEINALRDRPPNRPIQLPSLAKPGAVPEPKALSADSLFVWAMKTSPMIESRQVAIQRDRRGVEAAHLERYPEFTVGLQYRFRWVEQNDPVNGADFVGLSLGLNLPIFVASKQWEQQEVAQARVRESEAELAAGRSFLLQSIDRQLTDMASARSRAALYERRIIPQTRQAYESSLADYQAGRLEITAVLDNLLALLRARDERLLSLARIQMARAQLGYLLGGKWPRGEAEQPQEETGS